VSSLCRGCGKQLEWGIDDEGKKIPLDMRAPIYKLGSYDPDKRAWMLMRMPEGFKVTHFATCPKASEFSGARRTGTQPDSKAKAAGR